MLKTTATTNSFSVFVNSIIKMGNMRTFSGTAIGYKQVLHGDELNQGLKPCKAYAYQFVCMGFIEML